MKKFLHPQSKPLLSTNRLLKTQTRVVYQLVVARRVVALVRYSNGRIIDAYHRQASTFAPDRLEGTASGTVIWSKPMRTRSTSP